MAVRDLADVTEDPHLKAVGFFRQRTHPTEGEFLEMQPPVRYSDASLATIRTAPTLGEHSEEIRAELREAGLLT